MREIYRAAAFALAGVMVAWGMSPPTEFDGWIGMLGLTLIIWLAESTGGRHPKNGI